MSSAPAMSASVDTGGPSTVVASRSIALRRAMSRSAVSSTSSSSAVAKRPSGLRFSALPTIAEKPFAIRSNRGRSSGGASTVSFCFAYGISIEIPEHLRSRDAPVRIAPSA